MKNYTYIARDAAGATKRGVVQAPDRNAVLAALKAKGMIPVSITEGGRDPQSNILGWKSKIPLLVAVVLLVIVTVVALKLRPKTKTVDVKPPERPRADQIAKKTAPVTPIAAVKQMPEKQHTLPEENVRQEELGLDVPASAVLPTAVPPIAALPQTAESPATNPPARVFKTGTEQIISWIANSRLGNPPPPLPLLPPGDDIAAILNSDIILYDDDSEDIENVKVNVAYMKQLLKEYLAQGGKAQDFLSYYHTELWKAHTEWRESQQQLMELYKAGDTQGAREYAEQQSRVLQDKGIKPLVVPPALRQ